MIDLISAEPVRELSVTELGFSKPAIATSTAAPGAVEISHAPSLIGILDETYRQIEGAIKAGKRHIMLYGPPGTGKSELAQHIVKSLGFDPRVVTASSDWTSQELVGGYMPMGSGQIAFQAGALLRAFDVPLIIDEFNRCDVDRVLGPLFSTLADMDSTLPYLVDTQDSTPENISILAKGIHEPPRAYSPGPDWRIVATMNTSDKTSLSLMSFALMRRFAWIYIGVPEDKTGFVRRWCAEHGIRLKSSVAPVTIAGVWGAVTACRPLGAAPFIDVLKYCSALDATFDPSDMPGENLGLYVDALCVFVLPLLDGIRRAEAELLQTTLSKELGLTEDDASGVRLMERIDGLSA